MVRVSIDGTIAVGKTTVLDLLEKDGYIVNKEKTDDWEEWLNLYYTNMKKYAFGLQMRILYDKMFQSYTENKMNIYERSPYTLHNVFGKLLLKDGLMSKIEYELEEAYINKIWKPDYIIYLSCDTETSIERKQNHSVKANKNIDKKYLMKLNMTHDIVFDPSVSPIKVYKVYANSGKDEVYNTVKSIIGKIERDNFIGC
jgi:deoxyadenosine/deoxycytidine kinase